MIVTSMFEGDDDTHLMWLQHDVYGAALDNIVSRVKDYNDFAEAYLNVRRGDFPRSYDYRNLQQAHDVLAACYRFRHPAQQFELPFEGTVPRGELDMCVVKTWLNWLKDECISWFVEPRLISHIRDLIVEADVEFLKYWEEDLHFRLVERFRDVPWSASQMARQRPEKPETQLIRLHESENV
jgi:hypothetical protein